MNPSVKLLFDAGANDYDRQRGQLIPCFDEFYGMALSLADSSSPSPRILDLGAGTGLFSSMVMQKHPNAQFTLIDISDKMLEGARQRFNKDTNVEFIVADYSTHEFTSSFDLVISSLSIHHLTDNSKRQIFSTIHQVLSQGGVFVNADQVKANTSNIDAYYRERWLESIKQSGLGQKEIDASIERRKLDINAKLEDQISWLEQAGFVDVDCMYKNLDFAVFFGRKA